MAKDRYQVSLKLIVRDQSGRVLGLKGKIGGMYDGYFDLPGGRIEDTEFTTPFTTILEREVKEELGGVSIEIDSKPIAIGRSETPPPASARVLYVFFNGRFKDGAIAASEEHEGFEWLDLSNGKLEDYFSLGILEGVRSAKII